MIDACIVSQEVFFLAGAGVIGAVPQTAARTSFEQRRRRAASGTGRQLYLFVFVVFVHWSSVGRAGGRGWGRLYGIGSYSRLSPKDSIRHDDARHPSAGCGGATARSEQPKAVRSGWAKGPIRPDECKALVKAGKHSSREKIVLVILYFYDFKRVLHITRYPKFPLFIEVRGLMYYTALPSFMFLHIK